MKRTTPAEVDAAKTFAKTIGCPPEVVANLEHFTRRRRGWAVKRMAEQLTSVLDRVMPSDQDALRESIRRVSRQQRSARVRASAVGMGDSGDAKTSGTERRHG